MLNLHYQFWGLYTTCTRIGKNKFGFVFKNSKILSKRIEEIIFKNKFNSLSKNSKLWGLRNSDKKYLKKFKKKFFNSNI